MKDFLFLFRMNGAPTGSPDEMQAMTKRWMDWIGGIAAQNKLTDRGNRWKKLQNWQKDAPVLQLVEVWK